MNVFDIPQITTTLRQLAKQDAADTYYIGDFPGDYGYPRHLVANAQQRAKRRGLYMDAYLLYVAYYLEEYVTTHPGSEPDDIPTNETYMPFIESTLSSH